jgi:hypothetical protein
MIASGIMCSVTGSVIFYIPLSFNKMLNYCTDIVSEVPHSAR